MIDPLTYPKQVIKNFQPSGLNLNDIKVGEGGIVLINGKNYAAYKKSAQEFIFLSSICTHMKCQLKWDNTEKIWDCPCHGSKFSVEGVVLEGPAQKSLQRINIKPNI